MHFKNLPPTSFNNDSSSLKVPDNYRRSAYIFSSSYFTYCYTSWLILSFSIYCCYSFCLSCSLYLNKELYFVVFSRDFRNFSISQSILAVSIRSPSIPFYNLRLRNSMNYKMSKQQQKLTLTTYHYIINFRKLEHRRERTYRFLHIHIQ